MHFEIINEAESHPTHQITGQLSQIHLLNGPSFPIDLKYSLYNLPNSHLHLVLIIDYFVSWTICILLLHSFNYHVIVHFNVEWKGWGAYPPYPQILLFLFQNFPGYSNMFILIEL